jgi:ribulose 1,5-bisphosphate synthetase/thiazole synthase
MLARTVDPLVETLMSLLSPLQFDVAVIGAGPAGSAAALLLGELEYEVRANTINTFGGGTNEIQRELIAQFGLKLPRPVR